MTLLRLCVARRRQASFHFLIVSLGKRAFGVTVFIILVSLQTQYASFQLILSSRSVSMWSDSMSAFDHVQIVQFNSLSAMVDWVRV